MMDLDPSHPLVQEILLKQDQLRRAVWILSILLVLSLAGGGYEFARRHWPHQVAVTPTNFAPHDDPTIALVNGEPVLKSDVDANIEHVAGWPMLQTMVQQAVVFQAAQKKGLKLDDADSLRAVQGIQAVGLGYQVELRKLQARLLLRQFVLSDVSRDEREKFFNEFKPELTQYEVFALVGRTPAETRKISAELKKGVGMADLIARPGHLGHRLGYMTLSDIERELGPAVAKAIEDEPATEPPALGPFTLGRVHLFVRTGTVKNTYGDLELSVDDALASAGSTATLDGLLRTAKVSYPLAEAALKNMPAATAAPSSPKDDTVFGDEPAAIKKRSIFAPLPQAPWQSGSPSASPSASGSP